MRNTRKPSIFSPRVITHERWTNAGRATTRWRAALPGGLALLLLTAVAACDRHDDEPVVPPPTVIETVPASGGASIPNTTPINAVFSRAMSDGAFASGGFSVTCDGAAVDAAATYDAASNTALKEIATDEARYCAMLTRHIARLGGVASTETGAFLAKIRAAQPGKARLALLNRGQDWVVRRIREDLPLIGDEALRRDLAEMVETHERNIARCETLIA